MVVCFLAALAHNILVYILQLALCGGGGGGGGGGCIPRALAHKLNACVVTCTLAVAVAVVYIYVAV